MKLKIAVFIFGIIFSAKVFAQEKSFQKVDEYMKQMPKAATHSISSIVAFINEEQFSKTEKVRAVFDFITNHIAYDSATAEMALRNLHSPEIISSQNAETVLKRKVGICEGYSNLFKAICDSLHIKCFVVVGLAKPTEKGATINHGWNVVYINHQWHLIDATWGAGGYDLNAHRFMKKFSPEFFFMNADDAIEKHYPLFPFWQLSNHPVSFENFEKGKFLSNKKDSVNYYDSLKYLLTEDSMASITYQYQQADNFNKEKNSTIAYLIAHEYKSTVYNHYLRIFNAGSMERNNLIQKINPEISGKPMNLINKKRLMPLMKHLLQADYEALDGLKTMKNILAERINELNHLEKNTKENIAWIKDLAQKLNESLE